MRLDSQPQRPPSQPQATRWQKLSRWVEVFIYLLIILIGVKLYLPEITRANALKAELQKLEAERDQTELVVDQLKRENDNLKSDSKYLEVIARDRLNLQRDNEYIVQIKE